VCSDLHENGMICCIDLPPLWVTASRLEQAVQRSGRPHREADVLIRFPPGCKPMIDSAVRILSLANQLDFCTRRGRLDFVEGEQGARAIQDIDGAAKNGERDEARSTRKQRSVLRYGPVSPHQAAPESDDAGDAAQKHNLADMLRLQRSERRAADARPELQTRRLVQRKRIVDYDPHHGSGPEQRRTIRPGAGNPQSS
jgi:hypothetical protein